ncbi:MAG: TIGR03749 family integrating conjugative element protein [Halieaceae bacterium]|uniref:TIGR03749 family integrating conjugative element protein n=1 Tax=Haliea alexandrii TaxID=2448162 RepID=UPI000F0BD816|nr:TIGR03749 family integrating conjugative element protein [Haliea alexandrii]MCR9184744.1 TIGR03749 family integrating conjugative element protein [Halieaceae bacterium]
MQTNSFQGSSASRTVFFAVIISLCGLLLFSTTAAVALEPTERIVWRKSPIALELGVGQERMVHFPGPVSVGIQGSLQGRLRIQSSGGTVYWLAQQAFPPTRILVRSLDDGQVYLFDAAASPEGGSAAPMEITLPRQPFPAAHDQTPAGPANHGYVSLTRFAAQQLYAPQRLQSPLSGVVRVPVPNGSVPLVRGGAIVSTPLASWRSGQRFVTAVQLTNASPDAQELQAEALRGAWLAATFQHHRLLHAGDEADHTVVYLISDRPFSHVF